MMGCLLFGHISMSYIGAYYIKNVGMEMAFKSRNQEWLQPFMKLGIHSYVISFFHNIDEKASMYWYLTFDISIVGENYLINVNDLNSTSRLRFMSRTGYPGLKESLGCKM